MNMKIQALATFVLSPMNVKIIYKCYKVKCMLHVTSSPLLNSKLSLQLFDNRGFRTQGTNAIMAYVNACLPNVMLQHLSHAGLRP
jgi:hypothetical protein